MSGWLVSNVPSWLLLLGLNVLVAGGAVLALIYVRRRFPGLRGDERSEVTQFAFMLVGFVYAFFTGFIVTAMWGQNNSADDDMRVEGATAVQMAATQSDTCRYDFSWWPSPSTSSRAGSCLSAR